MTGRFKAEGTGLHEFPFTAPGGIYIVRVRNGNYLLSRKFMVHE